MSAMLDRSNLELAYMTWVEIREKVKEGYRTLVVPVGSTEQHGPHLPVFTDSILAHHISLSLARGITGLVGPVINLGYSPYHLSFPGTISLSSETLKSILRDYLSSLRGQGFERIIVLSAHGGNFRHINDVVGELRGEVRIETYPDFEKFSELINQPALKRGIPREVVGAHGGVGETSLMLYLEPSTVRMDRASKGFVGDVEEARRVMRSEGIHRVSSIGVIGDPTLASAEIGEEAFTLLVRELRSYFGS